MPALPLVRRLQRRFSFVLSAALCLWMLALASHFHINDYEADDHQGTHQLCAFCASVPSAGAAPAAVAFVAAPALKIASVSIEFAVAIVAPAIARYYSRGPPLV